MLCSAGSDEMAIHYMCIKPNCKANSRDQREVRKQKQERHHLATFLDERGIS